MSWFFTYFQGDQKCHTGNTATLYYEESAALQQLQKLNKAIVITEIHIVARVNISFIAHQMSF